MKVELIAADIDYLEELGVTVEQAFRRGLAEIAPRTTRATPVAMIDSTAELSELVHLYADEAAAMRLLQFAFATSAERYTLSARHYEEVEQVMRDLNRDSLPTLRGRLGELRKVEAALEEELRRHGIDPGSIGPLVPFESAIVPTQRPDEGHTKRRLLPPLAPRKSPASRILDQIRRASRLPERR
jgi:hypothetical protein